jgi:polysaccharide pyruvyl transferase WcaK-like protein
MTVTRDRPSRVALFGEFGRGNLGNDASLLAAVAELRAHNPDVEILCLCNAPEAVAENYGLNATGVRRHTERDRAQQHSLPLRLVRRAMDMARIYRIIRQVDVVMVPGTGILEVGSKRAGSFVSTLLMTGVAAYATRTSFALVSVGVDKAHRLLTRAVLRWTLRLATYRSFRDSHSKRYAARLGVRCDNDLICPDLVFGLNLPVDRATQVETGSVGVGLIAYKAAFFGDEQTRRDAIAAAYLNSVTSFIEWLLERGHDVTLLTGDRKDEDVAEEVCDRLRGDPIRSITIARSNTLEELLEHMCRVDLVVASRYHNIVAAALLAKPVISVNYGPKNSELMTAMGLERFHQQLEHIDDERLREQFMELQQCSGEVTDMLRVRSAEYREIVSMQWSTLTSTILIPAQRRRSAKLGRR